MGEDMKALKRLHETAVIARTQFADRPAGEILARVGLAVLDEGLRLVGEIIAEAETEAADPPGEGAPA